MRMEVYRLEAKVFCVNSTALPNRMIPSGNINNASRPMTGYNINGEVINAKNVMKANVKVVMRVSRYSTTQPIKMSSAISQGIYGIPNCNRTLSFMNDPNQP